MPPVRISPNIGECKVPMPYYHEAIPSLAYGRCSNVNQPTELDACRASASHWLPVLVVPHLLSA